MSLNSPCPRGIVSDPLFARRQVRNIAFGRTLSRQGAVRMSRMRFHIISTVAWISGGFAALLINAQWGIIFVDIEGRRSISKFDIIPSRMARTAKTSRQYM